MLLKLAESFLPLSVTGFRFLELKLRSIGANSLNNLEARPNDERESSDRSIANDLL
jgi:hypothetical protein